MTDWFGRPVFTAGRLRPTGADVVLATTILTIALIEILTGLPWNVQLDPVPVWVALAFGLGVVLLGRSSLPVASAVGVQLLLPFWFMVAQPGWTAYQLGAWLVSMLALGAHAPLRRSVVLTGLIALAWSAAAWAHGVPSDGPASVMLPLFAYGMGVVLGRRAEDRDRERSRAAALEEQQELRQRAGLADERARLARDLHDAVAHQVTVMAMTAGAVRRLLRPEQETERRALADVEAVGRQAVGEMHRIVHALRASEAPGMGAHAGIDALDELVGRARRAGAAVRLELAGVDRGALSPAISATAFRIVQESLTNTLRHAPGAAAAVSLQCTGDGLRIEVVDEGASRVPSTAVQGAGVGLIGMRERVGLLGGRMDAGPRDGATGWRVSAWLPAATAEPT